MRSERLNEKETHGNAFELSSQRFLIELLYAFAAENSLCLFVSSLLISLINLTSTLKFVVPRVDSLV